VVFPGLAIHRDWGLLALRVAVGIVFVVHGWPKLANAEGMAQAFGQPNPLLTAFFALQGVVEVIGGIAMLLGLGVQVAALAFSVIMLGAIGLKNTMWATPFASSTSTGWEFDFVLLAINLALLVLGPGRFALAALRRTPPTAETVR